MKKKIVLLSALLMTLTFVGASCSSSGGSDGGVFKSVDAASTWERKIFVDQQKKKTLTIGSVDVEELVIDPVTPDIMYMASKTDGIFKTTTAGEQWFRLNTPQDRVRDIGLHPSDPNILYAVHSRTILKSGDAGETWETVFTDTDSAAVMTRVTIDPSNGNRIYATTSTGSILISENEGAEWRVLYKVDEPVTGFIVHPTNSSIAYIVELESGLHKTVDGGKTWVNLFDDAFEDTFDDAIRIQQFTMDPTNPDTLYATSKEGIIRSSNGGESWEFVNTLLARDAAQNAQIGTFTVAPHNANVIYFTVGRLIHKSENRGQTWQTIETFPSSRNIHSFVFHPNNDSIIFAGGQKPTEKKSLFTP